VQQERKSFKNCWKCKNFSTQNKKSSTDSKLRKLILYCAYTEPRIAFNGSLNSRVWTILNSNIWNCVYWFDHANCFGTILFEVPMLLLNVFLSINHERFCSWIIHNSSLLYNGDCFNHWNSISKQIILSSNVCNRFGVYQLICKMLLNNPQLQSLQWHFFINHWNRFGESLAPTFCTVV